MLRRLTPGVVTLGAALAVWITQQSAVARFPLSAGLGRAWFAMFPVVAPPELTVASIAGLVVAASCITAFAGVVADPLQRRLGLHARRLYRLLDALERQMLDPAAPAYAVCDQYLARVLDICDLAGWLGLSAGALRELASGACGRRETVVRPSPPHSCPRYTVLSVQFLDRLVGRAMADRLRGSAVVRQIGASAPEDPQTKLRTESRSCAEASRK